MKFALFSTLLILVSQPAWAQSIVPGSNTIVTPNGDRFDISGGQFSRDGANLFHTFSQFGIAPNQIANFLSTPSIQNILARVNGSNPSVIQGLLQVSGGNSNLFLINPAGIVLGQNASLNVPGSFTATTATGIGFSNGTWNEDVTNLVGNPNSYLFENVQPGAIVNSANLTAGQNLTFLGGTVLSTGTLFAPNGRITIASVPGQNLVRLNVAGSPLGLDIQPIVGEAANGLSIAQLLTGGTVENASGVSINPDGSVQLNGAGIQAGDVAVRDAVAQSITLSAANDLKLTESQIQTGGNLNLFANRSVFVRDSVTTPFFAWAGGNLTIQGNQGIDILVLNHLNKTPFVSRGAMSLISDGIISGDAHFRSDRSFSILNRQGQAGNFVSYYDPIISVDGSVFMGDYTGVSLKIESTGNIQTGNIQVTGADINLVCNGVCSPDIEILRTRPAIILRAGVSSLEKPNAISSGEFLTVGGLIQSSQNEASFETVVDFAPPRGNITTGDLSFQSYPSSIIILDAKGDILVQSGGLARVRASEIQMRSGGSTTIEGFISTINAAGTGRFSIEAGGDVNLNSIATVVAGETVTNQIISGGTVKLGDSGVSLDLGGVNTAIRGRDIRLIGDLINTSGGNLELTATSSIDLDQLSDLRSQGGNLIFRGGSVSTQSALNTTNEFTNRSGSLDIQSQSNLQLGGALYIGNRGGNAPSLILNAPGTIRLDEPIFNLGANIGIGERIAPNKLILNDAIDTNGGNVSIRTASERLFLPSIDTRGGSVSIAETRGSIAVQNLTTSGGFVSLTSPSSITTEAIQTGGGNVQIQSGRDIEVSLIDATSLFGGGSININAARYFRATSPDVSLATSNNSITIAHGGSAQGVPFTVGQARFKNGTAGTIVAGRNTIKEGSFLFDYSQGEAPNLVRLITANPPVLVPAEEEEPTPVEPMSPIDVEFSDEPLMPVPAAEVEELDLDFSNEFARHLGLEERAKTTLEESQSIAAEIERQTGEKPAFIYVNYVPTAEQQEVVELIAVTAKGQPMRKVMYGVTKEKINAIAQQFLAGVTDRTSDDYLTSGQALYDVLIRPLDSHLKAQGITNLVFLMESGLRTLPIAALHDGQQFLIQKYSLGLMPSLSLTNVRYSNIKDAKLLAMGASQFQSLAPLPAVPIELATITQSWRQGQSLLNEAFTINNLITQRQTQAHGILHLATHSEFQPGSPSNSYIQFWDRQLTLKEIRGLNLTNPPVELLVLSACRTAIGDQEAELGFAGLAAQSGVKSALASLWYVSDEGTLALMSEFYQRLGNPQVKVKAEALRQAQIALATGEIAIVDGKVQRASTREDAIPLSHPYFWAAFTLIGNPW